MGWFILAHLFAAFLGLLGFGRKSTADKDLEILILRHRLNIVARKQRKSIKPNRTEKLILAVLVHKLKRRTHQSTQQLQKIVRIFKPETVLKWHRELVRRLVKQYAGYYHLARPHQGFYQRIPEHYAQPQHSTVKCSRARIISKPILGGLHHHYRCTPRLN